MAILFNCIWKSVCWKRQTRRPYNFFFYNDTDDARIYSTKKVQLCSPEWVRSLCKKEYISGIGSDLKVPVDASLKRLEVISVISR